MQSIPLAVLKHDKNGWLKPEAALHAIHTACGIETMLMEQVYFEYIHCMQSIPLAVLKLMNVTALVAVSKLHAIHTACGIETLDNRLEKFWVCILHAIHTACGIFFIFSALFSNVRFFYGIMELLEDSF